MYFFGYIEEILKGVLFSTCRQGSSVPDRYTDTRTSWGCSVVVDLGVPVIGLWEVERDLQGLTMGIAPLRRGEVPLHLQRHTVGVPENVNSLLRRVVHAVMCYSQHNVV
jgi:hypothetical protein